MAATPTLHTFDPLLPGKIGLYIDPPASYDIVIWLASKTTSGMSQVGTTNPNATDGLDGLSFIADGGAPGSVTYWTAKLHDSAGYGSPSAAVQATSSAGPPAPPAPTVPAAPTGVGAAASDGAAVVYWTPGSSSGSPITGYMVTPYANGVAQTPVGVTSASAALTGLADGTAYTFTVHAVNAVGSSAESPLSASVTPTAPPVPLTQVQHLEAAIGGTYSVGAIVQVFPPSPTLSVTVQADGSIS